MPETWLCEQHEHLEPLPLNEIKQHLAGCDTCSNNVEIWKKRENLAIRISTTRGNLQASIWAVEEHEADIKSYGKELQKLLDKQRSLMESIGVIEPGWISKDVIKSPATGEPRTIYQYGDLHIGYYCVVYGDAKELYRTKTYKIDLSAWNVAHDMAYKI